jgi:kynurenine 3-monooxygenase
MARDEGKVVVIGAGLVGSVLAMFLARHGLEVEVFESRPDPRLAAADDRALHLGIAARGLHALRVLGIDHAVTSHTIPMPGRIVHHSDGRVEHMRYGIRKRERQQSVPRGWLNKILVQKAAETGRIKYHFNHRAMGMDFRAGRLYVLDRSSESVVIRDRVVFDAGGAHSALRADMLRLPFVEYDQSHIQGDKPYCYKEIDVPPTADGAYAVEEKGLHMWPRGEGMFMALPNPHGHMAGAIIMPLEGPGYSFQQVKTADEARRMFADLYPDLLSAIPDLGEQYEKHPVNSHFTVHVSPWHFEDKLLLVGDAAHAMVPFFGQGMNCGFEDCWTLSCLMEEHGTDWTAIFPRFEEMRKPNGRAISDLSLGNFIEMRKTVDDPALSLRWNLEQLLEHQFPHEYITHYSLIVHHLVPYTFARDAMKIQEGILDELCVGLEKPEDVDLERARALIKERLGPLMRTMEPELAAV